ncbi:zonadhesin isoform X2 [Helicoverpa armigera]|uniref:zonadhesin isoform X2 n=1 Tax=Helicoverpa armigera TaxID=29058 RepID=UPI003083D294
MMLLLVVLFILPFTGGVVDNTTSKCETVPTCPRGEHYTRNDPECRRTCANRKAVNDGLCKPYTGCVCNPNLVRLNNDGTGPCVSGKLCGNRCRDRNAVFKNCPNPCPLTCASPNPKPCARMCVKDGCECRKGFVLNEIDGKCVRPWNCPEAKRCPKNARYVVKDTTCQKTCGNRLLPGQDPAATCEPFTGCVCKPGFARKFDNVTGDCIPETACPLIPAKCGLNEEPTSCRIVCPPQSCESIYSSYYCPPTECEPGCDCIQGYLRSYNDECVPADDCFDEKPVCGENEVETDCEIRCPPESCESLYTTYMCIETNCTAGCKCIEGYLRNSLGICIPSDKCGTEPAVCKDLNATKVECDTACPATCADPEPEACVDVCVLNGCQCKAGYILSERGGVCIEPKDCPGQSPVCGANQTYVDCKYGCSKYCPISDSRAQVACSIASPCPSGCACKPGYLKLSYDNPICINASDCPAVNCTRKNEVLKRNPTECFSERCEDRGKPCDPVYPATPRCVCKEGFFRNEDDECIPASECPNTSCNGDENAIFSDCPSSCQATCDNPNTNQPCNRMCMKPGCVCKPGFIKIVKDGKCIDPKKCPANLGCNGDLNATYSGCTSRCPAKCADLGKDDAILCPAVCGPGGCVCKQGYFLNDNGKCVKPEDCPATVPVDRGCNGDLNATSSECPSACPATCANRNKKQKNNVCIAVCRPGGCVCKPGFILTEINGTCVAPDDCPVQPPTCGANQTYVDCNVSCTDTCPTTDSRAQIACSIAAPCPSGCACKPGYLKLSYENPICVNASDCPPVKCTRPNEVLKRNPKECFSERCEDRGKPCDPVYPATPRCVCKEGFFRNEDDECIPASECGKPRCKDPNAVFKSCTSACEPTCSNPDTNRACIEVCKPPGCVCKPGFVLSEIEGKCVEPDNCPAKPCKDPNAVFKTCTSACEPTCTNPNTNRACIAMCKPPGCVCKTGFVFSETEGKCVKPEKCPVLGCKGDKNATLVNCPNACPLTCADNGIEKPCLAICLPSDCQCNDGYVLTERGGKCIKQEDCPVQPRCKVNEVFSDCPSPCQATCANPNTNQPCIKKCMPPGCVCKPGFVRSKENGECIELQNCPVLGCKGDRNATFVDCPSACPLTCADNGIFKPCLAACLPSDCQCNDGYVLTERGGKCIKQEDCPAEPQCNGDRNATSQACPSPCQVTCDQPEIKGACTAMCVKDGCVCKDGYIRNNTGGVCVQPEDCPGGSPTCGANKTYVRCNAGCPNNVCPKDDSLAIVACDPPNPCPGGCGCKPGYWRLSEENDTCVLGADCPPIICTRPNEMYNPNPPDCLQDRCDNRNTPCDFPYPKRPSCVCIDGYFRNSEGICVPEWECPVLECGYNEIEVPCHQKCPPQSCEIAYTEYICTKESQLCVPGCDCLPDHLRNASGICIPNVECPYPAPPVCGENEIARDCRRICPPQSCLSKYVLYRCFEDLPCEPGCDCIENYLRNKDGVCVPSEECPAPCHKREECKPTCANPNPPNCEYSPPKENIDGCDCKIGYVLSEIGGKCIPIEECPKDLGCNGDANATIKQCPMPCPARCDSPNAIPCKRKCDAIGCQCKPGYLISNVTGKCILPNECPGGNPCGKNGRFVDCKSNCTRDYCPIDDKPRVSCNTSANSCLPGCICELNHKRLSVNNDTCIVSSDCPPINCTRPGEEYNSCPSPCRKESCKDINNQPTVCNTLLLNCEPDCICKKDYFRNSSGICIPAKDCPCRNEYKQGQDKPVPPYLS